MKKIRLLGNISGVLLGLVLNGCVVTDYIVAPVDSIPGGAVVEKLQNAAAEGFYSGLLLNPNAQQMLTSLPAMGGNASTAGILSGRIVTRFVSVDENSDYTAASVDGCVAAVKTAFATAMANGLEPPPVWGSLIAAEQCKLEKTGKIIHVSDKIKL